MKTSLIMYRILEVYLLVDFKENAYFQLDPSNTKFKVADGASRKAQCSV
eukprot:UN03203